MQEEWYEPTRRDKLRAAAFASTPAGRRAHERDHELNMRCIDWRVRNEGFVPPPETMKSYEEWLAKHPELYKNKHPHK